MHPLLMVIETIQQLRTIAPKVEGRIQTVSSEQPAPSKPVPSADKPVKIHTVKRGDTLWAEKSESDFSWTENHAAVITLQGDDSMRPPYVYGTT